MNLRTQQRYHGCLTTPPLWEGTTVSPFRQIALSLSPEPLEETAAFDQHRLGKLAEAFVFHVLKKQPKAKQRCIAQVLCRVLAIRLTALHRSKDDFRQFLLRQTGNSGIFKDVIFHT